MNIPADHSFIQKIKATADHSLIQQMELPTYKSVEFLKSNLRTRVSMSSATVTSHVSVSVTIHAFADDNVYVEATEKRKGDVDIDDVEALANGVEKKCCTYGDEEESRGLGVSEKIERI
ncbi:hypothetical protein JHK85_001592 [Glycine max]|nr:hypothetical protein JHK85_001592 [Glycine max]